MKKLRLTLIAVFVFSVSVLLVYQNALAEIRTMKIKIPSCM
jgi:hypothetical protein